MVLFLAVVLALAPLVNSDEVCHGDIISALIGRVDTLQPDLYRERVTALASPSDSCGSLISLSCCTNKAFDLIRDMKDSMHSIEVSQLQRLEQRWEEIRESISLAAAKFAAKSKNAFEDIMFPKIKRLRARMLLSIQQIQTYTQNVWCIVCDPKLSRYVKRRENSTTTLLMSKESCASLEKSRFAVRDVAWDEITGVLYHIYSVAVLIGWSDSANLPALSVETFKEKLRKWRQDLAVATNDDQQLDMQMVGGWDTSLIVQADQLLRAVPNGDEIASAFESLFSSSDTTEELIGLTSRPWRKAEKPSITVVCASEADTSPSFSAVTEDPIKEPIAKVD